jgi:hypothetical protein
MPAQERYRAVGWLIPEARVESRVSEMGSRHSAADGGRRVVVAGGSHCVVLLALSFDATASVA